MSGWHDGKTIAEIVHEYAAVRGDLSEQYARDQLVSIIEGRIRAGCVETERQVRAAVLDALGDDPAQATVERVEALAWVTQDICDCDSMKGRAGAHRDECPVMVLRAALDPETGQ